MNELGAQDPELKNSPIAWELDEEIETLRSLVQSAIGFDAERGDTVTIAQPPAAGAFDGSITCE